MSSGDKGGPGSDDWVDGGNAVAPVAAVLVVEVEWVITFEREEGRGSEMLVLLLGQRTIFFLRNGGGHVCIT